MAAAGADDADADSGIGVAGLGIALLIDGGVGGDPIGDGICGDFVFVHFEVGDGGGIGRPCVIGADFELFSVDPIDFAVEDVGVGRRGDGFGCGVGGERDDEEAVIANEGDGFSVGGELGIVARVGGLAMTDAVCAETS